MRHFKIAAALGLLLVGGCTTSGHSVKAPPAVLLHRIASGGRADSLQADEERQIRKVLRGFKWAGRNALEAAFDAARRVDIRVDFTGIFIHAIR